MVPSIAVNWIAVIAAAVASFIVGWIWYSPALFGKQWMKMMGVTQKEMEKQKSSMMGVMITTLVLAVITAYVLAVVLHFMGALQIMDGVVGAFWVWLGFYATSSYMAVMYEKKSMEWWFLTAGHHLVSLIVMAIVLIWMGA